MNDEEKLNHEMEAIRAIIAKVEASKGKRLLNGIIDSVCAYIFMFFLMVLTAFLFAFFYQPGAEYMTGNYTALKVYVIASYFLYYFLFEWLTGRTFGKLITKTHVISSNNKPLKIWHFALRSLLRLIPVLYLSILFNNIGLHDKWSNSRVIVRRS